MKSNKLIVSNYLGINKNHVVQVAALVFIFSALLLPNRLSSITPLAFVSIPLEAPILGLLLLISGRSGQVLRSLATCLLACGILFKLADLGTYQAFDRPFNPVLDGNFLPNGMNLLQGAIGSLGAYLVVALLLVSLVGIFGLVYSSLSCVNSLLRVLSGILHLPVSFGELLLIRQAGQAVNFITPGPQFGGEPLQLYWLCRRDRLPLHSALLALGLDRCYELCINFSILLLSVLLLQTSPSAEVLNWQKFAIMLLLILLTLSGLAWLILHQPERIANWFTRVTERWLKHPRLRDLHNHRQRFSKEIKHILTSQKPALLKAMLISLCGWAGLLAELWLLLSFFDLALDLSAFLLILVSLRLAFLLPLPGGIGPLEAALFWAFQFLSLPPAAAMGLIALMRLRDAVVLLLGFSCLRVLQQEKL